MDNPGFRNVVISAAMIKAGNRNNITVSSNGNGNGYTIIHRATPEVRIDPDKRPTFTNITDDYNLLENMNRYSRFCEQYNVAVPQMVQSLARAIGIQNGGRVNVLIYEYLLAMPEYPPTLNGKKQALTGENHFCNIVCYKSQLFGVCVFPVTDNVTFYFPEFSSFTPYVQDLIFTYGYKALGYCPRKKALAFEFRSEPTTGTQPVQPILLTATLKRKMTPELVSPTMPPVTQTKSACVEAGEQQQQQIKREPNELVQLD